MSQQDVVQWNFLIRFVLPHSEEESQGLLRLVSYLTVGEQEALARECEGIALDILEIALAFHRQRGLCLS